jgi:hypothetical protein
MCRGGGAQMAERRKSARSEMSGELVRVHQAQLIFIVHNPLAPKGVPSLRLRSDCVGVSALASTFKPPLPCSISGQQDYKYADQAVQSDQDPVVVKVHAEPHARMHSRDEFSAVWAAVHRKNAPIPAACQP